MKRVDYLFSQGQLCYRWDASVESLGYLPRIIKQALASGGYLADGQEILCEYFMRDDGALRPGEHIFALPRPGFEFKVTRRGSRREDLLPRRLADYQYKKLFGQEDLPNFPIILIQEIVLGQILSLAKEGQAKHQEIAGLLIGQPYRDTEADRYLIDIHSIIPATTAPATSVSVRFTIDVMDRLNQIKEANFPTAKKVGWYHSHPAAPTARAAGEFTSSVFFSQMDSRVHDQFRVPWQVALVVDGSGRDARFFRWADEQCERIIECRGFYTYSTEGPRDKDVSKKE